MKILNIDEYFADIRKKKEQTLEAKIKDLPPLTKSIIKSLSDSMSSTLGVIGAQVITFDKMQKQEAIRIKTKNGRFKRNKK